MKNIPFTRRSLCTVCAQIAREQRDDDISFYPSIPVAHIVQRWTRNARDMSPSKLRVHNYKGQSDYSNLLNKAVHTERHLK
ncbi:unnamed protein product [Urochloa humidicola]